MIDRTIQDLEAQIRSANLSEAQKVELQNLVASLKTEVAELAQSKEAVAASTSVASLRASVEKFESSHPTLTLTVNELSTYLANLGL